MDQELAVYAPGYVAVSGDRIAGVGSLDEVDRFAPAEIIDARDKIILPGLINGHQHAPMSLLRGLADDLKLMDWLNDYIFPVEAAAVDEAFVYWGTLLSAWEMISSGTTTFSDMYYFEDKVAEAVSQSGMRGILGQTIIGFRAPDYATPQEALRGTAEFIRRWENDPLVTPAVAPHAPYTCSKEVLLAAQQLATRYDVPLLIHLSETREEVSQILEQTGKRPIEYLAELGLLTDRLVAFHVVWPENNELALLRDNRVGVIHNPHSNMKLASGVAPVPEMLELGVAVGLGTDGAASNNNLDMFEQMGTMAKLFKLTRSDPTRVGARDALLAATRGGAQALDRADEIGSLAAGKKADLIIVGLDQPAARPVYDPYSSVVYALRGSSVETVMVDGRFLMRQREMLTLDTASISRAVSELKEKILATLSE